MSIMSILDLAQARSSVSRISFPVHHGPFPWTRGSLSPGKGHHALKHVGRVPSFLRTCSRLGRTRCSLIPSTRSSTSTCSSTSSYLCTGTNRSVYTHIGITCGYALSHGRQSCPSFSPHHGSPGLHHRISSGPPIPSSRCRLWNNVNPCIGLNSCHP